MESNDYAFPMTTTLTQSQAELPRLVELASRGEDVVIVVDGKPKARLTRADAPRPVVFSENERQMWLAELADLRNRLTTGRTAPAAEQLIEEDRADR
jgi:antitoxin (DNA-binding transcriptional repressor) of toxin-antitoxin stability system